MVQGLDTALYSINAKQATCTPTLLDTATALHSSFVSPDAYCHSDLSTVATIPNGRICCFAGLCALIL